MTDSLEETVAEVINDLYKWEQLMDQEWHIDVPEGIVDARKKLERAVQEGS